MKNDAPTRQPLLPGDLVYGFDPGRTTGFVCIKYLGGSQMTPVDVREIAWADRHSIADLFAQKIVGRLRCVVAESFFLYPSAAQQLIYDDFPSSQVIGMIDIVLALAIRQKNAPACHKTLILQNAAQIHRMRQYMSRSGNHPSLGTSEHILDAYAHAALNIFRLQHLGKKQEAKSGGA